MKKVARTNKPLISVVMPVYNAGEFVAQSIDSILGQTYKNFEFIIVDDASTDNSWEVLKKYARKSKKIKIFRNKVNLHSAKTVTYAMNMAKGDYIARMDADDIALPRRLELELQHLLKNKKTVAVGGQCILVDENNSIIGEKRFPTRFKDIYNMSFKFCPAQQPAMMIARHRLPKNFPFYDHGLTPVEDMELLFKLYKYGKVENLKDFVLMYRIHSSNSSLKNFKKSFILTLISRLHGVLYHGYKPTVTGVLVTCAQTVAVLLLPQNLTFTLYKAMKKISSPTPSVAYGKATLPVRLTNAL
jgi:glycosyltransferase involved in cell wall biosynthesis